VHGRRLRQRLRPKNGLAKRLQQKQRQKSKRVGRLRPKWNVSA
jgi:hypothetical protein